MFARDFIWYQFVLFRPKDCVFVNHKRRDANPKKMELQNQTYFNNSLSSSNFSLSDLQNELDSLKRDMDDMFLVVCAILTSCKYNPVIVKKLWCTIQGYNLAPWLVAGSS